MIIIGWLYSSSQVLRIVEVVDMQVGVWRSQLQVVCLPQATQDYRHHSLVMTESMVFFASLATLE